ncbi:MAG: DUF2057 family protein [Moraxella sp.]|nr:DUF2057 family protein [Moraxella sp.]
MKKMFLALTLLGATTAYADVTLNVDDNIKVTAINGQNITQSALQPLKRQFNLAAGRHVITAKYDRLYDNVGFGNSHDYLRSDNVTVTADLADNQTYRLVMPGQPTRYNDAKEYAKAPTLAIMQGNTVIAQESATAKTGGLFGAIGSVFGRSDAASENQRVISAVQNQPAPAPVSAPVTRPNAGNLDTFMQIWLNASDEERQKIRQWVQQ